MLVSTLSSAFVGQPPANQADYDIIRGIYRTFGIADSAADPSLGYKFAPVRPEDGGHQSKQGAMIAGMAIVILAILVPTAARIWIKISGCHTKFGLEDWVIIAAAALAVVYPILVIVVIVEGGAGLHLYDVTYQQYNTFFYYCVICKDIFYVAVGIIKLSIAFFVYRLSERISKGWRIFVNVYLAVVICYIFAAFYLNTCTCNPSRANWNKLYSGSLDTAPECLNSANISLALTIIHVTTGMVLLSAPIIILWKIQIDTGKKIRLFIIWIVGGITVLGGLLQTTSVTITNDATWQVTSIIRWTCLDLCLGLLAASLPVLDSAIMGSWRAASSMLGGSSRSRTRELFSVHNDGSRPTIQRRGTKEYEELTEDAVSQGKDGVEMQTFRTDAASISKYPENHSAIVYQTPPLCNE